MSGSASPDPPTNEAGDSGRDEITVAPPNGPRSPDQHNNAGRVKSSPPRTRLDGDIASPNLGSGRTRARRPTASADGEGADSEAETLIDSPVKKQEIERQNNAIKQERPPRHRIGSLPVPTDNDDENDSPSTALSIEDTPTVDREDVDSEKEDDSESLSSARSGDSDPPSRGPSLSRAASERPDYSRQRAESSNPRKRKHRASSVSLPNKRPSIEASKARLRGLNSEGTRDRNQLSPSPKLRSHRRAVSTQSALTDGGIDGRNRNRKSGTNGPGKESKNSRNGWEESDASSEATSHGHTDHRRPTRGIGRSTSTPGRPPGREHKRHVNKYGFTKLAEACETGELDLVKEWLEKDPEQLELAEFAGNKPLQIAALNGNVEVVDYLISQGCQIDCANVDKDTPLIDAAENGHVDVVNSLLKAGVDPLRQNLKGQQALDVATDETDDVEEIRACLRRAIDEWNSNGAKQKREEEEEQRHRAGPTKELHFMARTYENLLKLVTNNDRNGVREFLDARVAFDNGIIAAAAKTGDSYLVNMLLVELPEKKALQKAEKPLLSVLGTSHYEMVKTFTELDNFNPLYRDRQGKSWPEIAEAKHGPNWRKEREHLQKLYDASAATKESRSSSPVTKRDSNKRRLVSRPAEDESDEEEAPSRSKGRKLMSRRELRAAKGKAISDASSDESSSELATGTEAAEESSMKPPESPALKRTPTRSRTKSFHAQSLENSPRTRRRSLSMRGSSDHSLPTLDENGEDHQGASKDGQEDDTSIKEEPTPDTRRKDAEAEAAAKRAAEEEAREAEQAEEARKEEERRAAEAARREEEERKRQEEEQAEKKRVHREQILSALPSPWSYVLSPTSAFDYNSEIALYRLVYSFMPLQVLKIENDLSEASVSDAAFWVINVQAAPLLGKHGVEIMLREDSPGFSGSLADLWNTQDVEPDTIPLIKSMLASLPQDGAKGRLACGSNGQHELSFEEELAMVAERLQAAADAKDRLRNCDAILRLVRLDDVLEHLHPTLKNTRIEVRFDYLENVGKPLASKENDDQSAFSLPRRPLPRTYIQGRSSGVVDVDAGSGVTRATVVEEK